MLYLPKHIAGHLFAFFQDSLEEKDAEETLRNDLQPARCVLAEYKKNQENSIQRVNHMNSQSVELNLLHNAYLKIKTNHSNVLLKEGPFHYPLKVFCVMT